MRPARGRQVRGASGQGASGGGGNQCDDALKRCPTAFSYPDGGEQSVELRGNFKPDGWDNGVALTLSQGSWQATVEVPWNTDVEYKFLTDGTNWVNDPSNPDTVSDGNGGTNSLYKANSCSDFICSSGQIGTFDWRDSIIYFVFVDRFLDGDPSNNGPSTGAPMATDFQGGDWVGVRQKIDEGYFNDLGVNTLWLSVPVDNTDALGAGSDGYDYSAYHAYWPADLEKPEERFGTMQELKDLVTAAHAKDLKVIFDYAMNHVHISSPVYQQHQDWFWPLDNNGKNCVCGDGCSWDGADGARCWFTSYLPDFNFQNPDARAFSVNNAVWWAKETKADGFRLDAVKHIDETWLADLRSKVTAEIESETGEHFYMVGETFTGDRDTIGYYVNPALLLDGQFDFPLRAKICSTTLLRSEPMTALDGFLQSNDSFYGASVMSTFIGNHDLPRVIHLAEDSPLWSNEWDSGKDRAWDNLPGLPGGNSAFERMANGFTLIFTMKGAPLVYYGDEYGMPGGGDPDNRRFMQWSGYSSGQTFLYEHIKKLTKIRSEHEALRRGTRSTVYVDDDVMAYEMKSGASSVYVAVNRSDSARDAQNLPSGSLTDVLGGGEHTGPTISIPARSARVLVP